jgi:hypothetical protein
VVKTGDAETLKLLLELHPMFYDQILAVASPHVGMSAVKRAMAMTPKSRPQEPHLGTVAPGQVAHADFLEGGAVELEGKDPAAKPKVKAAEPGWITAASTYNTEHAERVEEFNNLTNNSCAMDGVNNDPKAIAAWQKIHGLAGDGKVGPQTLAAARKKGGPAADHALTKEQLDAAQTYNEAHPALLAKLTDILGSKVTSAQIAALQKANALAVDGRVGPDTIAAAEKTVQAHPEQGMLE